MKLAILKIEARATGNFTWTCIKADEGTERIWELMGHKVVELPDEKGNELLRRASEAIMLQFELSFL